MLIRQTVSSAGCQGPELYTHLWPSGWRSQVRIPLHKGRVFYPLHLFPLGDGRLRLKGLEETNSYCLNRSWCSFQKGCWNYNPDTSISLIFRSLLCWHTYRVVHMSTTIVVMYVITTETAWSTRLDFTPTNH